MKQDIVASVKDRVALLDDLITDFKKEETELGEKQLFLRNEIQSMSNLRDHFSQFLEKSKQIEELLSVGHAEQKTPPSTVPQPTLDGGVEPVEIEVNHVPAVEGIADRENENDELAPRNELDAKEKIIASLTQNPDQTAKAVAKQAGVSVTYVRLVCSENNLSFKKSKAGRPATVKAKVEEALEKNPGASNHGVARALGCAPKTVRNVRQSMEGSNGELVARPARVVEPNRNTGIFGTGKKPKTLFRLKCPKTGHYLHQDLMGMTDKNLKLVEGKQFAWTGTEKQMDGCQAMLPTTLDFTIEEYEVL